ncbi:MAG: LacI family DNA-binding transcriptional regulator [Pseudomonadota bacterium]|nr:LacI family DNA-binding transcriptional regulator [Pseudomonadota bacterium]
MSKRNLTIDDVAKAAGVARVTVSRVLNNGPNVRPQTRDRVQRAVKELGYSVNLQARALASGVGRQVVLVHAHNPDQEPNSYYHAALELGALRACSSLGFDLVTRSVDPDGDETARFLSAIIDRERPVGIIVSPPFSDDLDLLREARRLGARIVAISAGEGAHDLVPGVGIDERAAGRLVGEFLLSLGHRRLGFVKGPEEHRAAAIRYLGFTDALEAGGVTEQPWVGQGDFTFKSGVEAAERMLREMPNVTALACANDDMAAGALLALHRHDVNIPSDISVTGFDDTPMSEIVWPPLTTVRQPIKLLAERAVYMLLDADRAPALPARYELIEHKLIIRESTAAI